MISENYSYDSEMEAMVQEELEEAEQMVRNGCTMRQLRRKQFTFLGQSDIFRLYRKYGRDAGEEEELW